MGFEWNLCQDSCTRFERERDAASARAERAEVAIERVRALHRQVVDSSWPEPGHCQECVDAGGDAMDYRPYPCATIAALDVQLPAEERSEEATKAVIVSDPHYGHKIGEEAVDGPPFPADFGSGQLRRAERKATRAGLPVDGEERTNG